MSARGPGRPGLPHSQAVRVVRLLRALERSPSGLTLTELAAHTGVVTRTVRRDLLALAIAGEPLVRVGRRWSLSTSRDVDLVAVLLAARRELSERGIEITEEEIAEVIGDPQ